MPTDVYERISFCRNGTADGTAISLSLWSLEPSLAKEVVVDPPPYLL
jgi:hypothetical protein